jgi:hypothetical protein
MSLRHPSLRNTERVSKFLLGFNTHTHIIYVCCTWAYREYPIQARAILTDPRVRIPDKRGGGFTYKRTVVDEFNSGVDSKLDASRLTRIKLSSQQINELELALQRRLDKRNVATAADKSTCGGLSAGASASTPATYNSTNGEENDSSGDEETEDIHVPLVQTSHSPWLWALGQGKFAP